MIGFHQFVCGITCIVADMGIPQKDEVAVRYEEYVELIRSLHDVLGDTDTYIRMYIYIHV